MAQSTITCNHYVYSIHRPRDSLFSWSSGFAHYEGVMNWAFLMLTIGGLRLLLENYNKYGVRVDPTFWVRYFPSLLRP